MKRLLISTVGMIIAANMAMTENLSAPKTSDPLSAGNTAFALSLYGRLGQANGNLCFSPFSISSALSMTLAGAHGKTAKEMKEALHFKIEQDQLPSAFKNLNTELAANASNGDQKLRIANGLCLTGGTGSEAFKTLLKENYDAEIFSGDLDRINMWVKLQTAGRIDKILDRLGPNSVCVLLNAIYFKGTWEHKFRHEETHDAPFHVSKSQQITISLMNQKGKVRTLEQADFQAVSIPYMGNCLSMVLFLPREIDGLASLEEQLTGANWQKWLSELDQAAVQEVQISMPKFKLETGYDLIPACKNLGIQEAFEAGKADFTGMGGRKGDLWISQIKHKAFIEVNEEGTEAAAATAVEMKTRAIMRLLVFRADHPFLFFIRDNQTGTVLFMGRIVEPL